MRMSLNEIQALVKASARGAGYSWGIAEEAGIASRWLAEHGLDAGGLFARLFVRFDGVERGEMAPLVGGAAWRAQGHSLCPLTAGATLSDRAGCLSEGTLEMHRLVEPAIMLPFIARLAQLWTARIELDWEDGRAVTDGEDLSIIGKLPRFSERVTLTNGAVMDAPLPGRSRADAMEDDLDSLRSFAHRTYAPATDESRRVGAGAGE